MNMNYKPYKTTTLPERERVKFLNEEKVKTVGAFICSSSSFQRCSCND